MFNTYDNRNQQSRLKVALWSFVLVLFLTQTQAFIHDLKDHLSQTPGHGFCLACSAPASEPVTTAALGLSFEPPALWSLPDAAAPTERCYQPLDRQPDQARGPPRC